MTAAKLKNDRFRLDIDIAGYEFQRDFLDQLDANWLIFRVVLQSQHGAWRWQVEDAGALTWEVAGCVRWLRDLQAGRAVEQEHFGFSEPDVSFDVIRNDENEVIGLGVNLMDEFQPPTKVLIPRENNVVSLRFHTPPDVLQNFADALETALVKFPQRGERPEIKESAS